MQAEAARFGAGLDLLAPYLADEVTIGSALERMRSTGEHAKAEASSRFCRRCSQPLIDSPQAGINDLCAPPEKRASRWAAVPGPGSLIVMPDHFLDRDTLEWLPQYGRRLY